MKRDRICKYCHKQFLNTEGRVFSNHVRWCKENKTNGDKGLATIKNVAIKRLEESLGELIKMERVCPQCKNIFIIEQRTIKAAKKREHTFCSISCGNRARIRRKESFKKTSDALRGRRISRLCKECGLLRCENLDVCLAALKLKRLERQRVSFEAAQNFKNYRSLCRFSFGLSEFPNEFDFELIKTHGWYAAINHGNNPDGISRDHIISILYGYKHNISPRMISHPANCQLLLQKDNLKKRAACGMTEEELKLKIEEWDKKYPPKI